jgi:hypothetical protein
MQNGDLEAHVRDRIIVVIEGVLCLPIQEKARSRWGREKTVAYHINWYDVPLKRLIVTNERNPDLDVELVSFISQAFVDHAADYLDMAGIPYSGIKFWDFGMFTSVLKFQRNLRAIYDTDPDQLQKYGQVGVAVQQGHDF